MEKTFAGGCKITKLVKVFSLKRVSCYTVCAQCYTVSLDLGGYNRQPTDTAGYGPDLSALLQNDSRAELGHSVHLHTVFPQNLAAARFNFKSLHPAVKFRGRQLVHSPVSRDFEVRQDFEEIL